MIRAVLFDMDGTVLDSEQIYYRGWKWAAEQTNLPGDIVPHLPMISGMNHADIGRYFAEHFGEEFPYERYMEYRTEFINKTIAEEGLPLKPGVPAVFDRLHALGCRVALVTSTNPKRTALFMELTGIGRYFDRIITGNMVEHSKPAPDIYLMGAQEVGCDPAECLVCEDSRNGVIAGHRASMRVVMIPDLQPITDEILPMISHVCKTLNELPDIVSKL